jgi:hypothetical protein
VVSLRQRCGEQQQISVRTQVKGTYTEGSCELFFNRRTLFFRAVQIPDPTRNVHRNSSLRGTRLCWIGNWTLDSLDKSQPCSRWCRHKQADKLVRRPVQFPPSLMFCMWTHHIRTSLESKLNQLGSCSPHWSSGSLAMVCNPLVPLSVHWFRHLSAVV